MSNRRRMWMAGVAAVVLSVGPWASAFAQSDTGGPRWNPRTAAELTEAMHRMHTVWDSGDQAALKSVILGDEALVTFELDPRTHEPVRLASKAALDRFVDAIVADQEATNTTFELENPVVNCKGLDDFGVCTEECVVRMKTPDGTEEVHRLWSTATAVKLQGEWKWIQWHMSKAAPPQIFKNGRLVTGGK